MLQQSRERFGYVGRWLPSHRQQALARDQYESMSTETYVSQAVQYLLYSSLVVDF